MRALLSILTISFFTVSAISAVTETAPEPTAEMVQIVKRSNIVIEDSSSHNRMGKTYQITGQVIGATVSPVSSLGINFGYFLDRNTLLQVEHSHGETTWFFTKIKTEMTSVHIKRFFGNSFYAKGGLDYRRIGLKTDGFFFSEDVENFKIGQSDVFTGSVVIGNQWQFENFTLGCDWVGITLPIATNKNEINSERISDDYDRKRAERDWEDINKANTAQILRFYLGASF